MKTKLLHSSLIIFSFLFAACSPIERLEQPEKTIFVPLNQESIIGQTFVARYDGLYGIKVYLKPGDNPKGALVLNLRSEPESDGNLAATTLSLEEIKSEGYYELNIPTQKHSTRKNYYALLNIRGPGEVMVGISDNPDHYLNGALYNNHTPLSAQLTFQLLHSRKYALIGLIKEGLTWFRWLLICIFLFAIPGWAILKSLWPKWHTLHWAEKLGLAGGFSLAIYPLLILWTSLIGLRLGALYAWIPPILGTVLLLWGSRKDFRLLPKQIRIKSTEILSNPSLLRPELALLIVISLIIVTRFWAVRDLDVPMWGDSYQHTMITQLLVDNKGLFNSWQPFAEMTTFTYHFGFHSVVAVFHWMTDLPMHKAMLWMGQILNGMAVIFLFPLVIRMKRNVWGGTVALLLAGLLIAMPMFYVNWGRYTQLAGLAILPAMIYFAWVALDSELQTWPIYAVCGFTMAGLAITHYRVLVFAILFYPAYIILYQKIRKIPREIIVSLLTITGAFILVLPWFINFLSGRLPTIIDQIIGYTSSQISKATSVIDPIGDPSQYLPPLIWLFLIIVIGWRLWRRDRSVALISLWYLFIYLSANPHILRLPGTRLISNFAVLITAYIPASIILGSASGYFFETITQPGNQLLSPHGVRHQRSVRKWLPIVLLLLIGILGLWGARERLWDIDAPTYSLVTRPDLLAFDWVKENSPIDSRFLVNSFFAFDGTAIVGSDGGWWLPLLASRQTSLPPLNYSMERGPSPKYVEWINQLNSVINQKGIEDPEVLNMLHDRKITHVYVGQRQGNVNSPGAMIHPDELMASPIFQLIYHRDRVWIYKIIY